MGPAAALRDWWGLWEKITAGRDRRERVPILLGQERVETRDKIAG